jgi:hypothetical protein
MMPVSLLVAIRDQLTQFTLGLFFDIYVFLG